MDIVDSNTSQERLRRRRRGSSFVTKTACRECRKGRAKCDGQKPCARCVLKGGLTCEYEVSVHVRKDAMRQEIGELRTYRQQTEKIFESLATDGQSDFIIHKLQQGTQVEDIYKQLTVNSSIAGSLDSGRSSQWWYGSQTDRSGSGSPSVDVGPEDSLKLGSRWTNLSLSDTVIEQLLLLYFCWEYPIFSCISKRHFIKDFNTYNDRYCSSLLVNAILAIGCRFADCAEARADPDNSETAGMHCYAEAERLFEVCRKERSITTIQAMSLMSTWNASYGNHKKARFYAGQSIRMATEAGLHQERGVDDEVRYTAFWGAFMLDQAWSLAAGCLPYISQNGVPTREATVFDEDELCEWVPYTGDPIRSRLDLQQPSNIHGVYSSLRKLSTIIHGTLYVLYTADSFSSQDLLDQYVQMLGWYSSLGEVLQLRENSTPTALFAHMYYHFSLILIFYPLRKTPLLDTKLSALEVCTDAANAIVALARSYESLHVLRRTPCFLPYIIFASGIVHLSDRGPKNNLVDSLTQPTQQIAILQLMSLYHGSSKRACRILLQQALRSSSSTGGRDSKDPDEDAYSLWEPFMTTMPV